jgi:protein TonB
MEVRMPDELFRTVVVRRPTARRLGAIPLSVAVHVALILLAVIVPLLATDILPAVSIPLVMQMPAMPAVAVPTVPVPRAARPLPTVVALSETPAAPLVAPRGITDSGVVILEAVPQIRSTDLSTIPGIGQPVSQIEAPPPPRLEARPNTPVRIGGKVLAPQRIRSEAPVYPPLAIRARVEGVVVIEAIISTTGAVQQARVVTSVPLLDEAALAAVRQWVFTPTLLNGVPVPVIMTVNVEFKLR